MYWKGQHAVNINAMSQRQKGKEMEKENKMGQEKKVQIKVMIKKIKNKVWLFLKKIYTKLPEKMKVHIRKLKPKEKIRGVHISEEKSQAVEKGLSVQIEDRYQQMADLYYDLYGETLSGEMGKQS